jgi:hypothetical protein
VTIRAIEAGLAVALTLPLLVVCCFAPGFFFLRWPRWSPMEKLCGSIGLSLILLYLSSWFFFWFAPGMQTAGFYGVSIVSVVLGFISRKDILRLIQSFRVRHALFGFSFLLLWTLVILSMIRHYSGAGWGMDWMEHYQRALFFLYHFPANTPIVTNYALSARPPMMNVLGTFFLAQTGNRFESFQVAFAFLNLLVFLPCCLILPALAGPRKLRVTPLMILFVLSPIVMEAATYTWTKSLTAFFVVLGFWFYLVGWRKKDFGRMAAAFVALSAGLLVHYSAGPYCAFIGLHYLLCVFWKRERKWKELTIIGAACLLLLFSWFGWSIATYGVQVTFGSNSSIQSSHAYAGSSLHRIGANIYDTVVPRILREPSTRHEWDQPRFAATIRDNFFILYQSNLIFSMGLTAGPLILWLLYRAFRRADGRSAERRFWLAMIPFCVVVGIAVVGERDYWGVAHLTLFSLEILGISFLAASFPLPRMAGLALMIGCTADFLFGVFLQAHVEHIEYPAQRIAIPGMTYVNGISQRPGGTIHFLGDHFGNSWFGRLDAQSVLLLLVFLGLMWKLWNQVSPKQNH